MGIYGEKLTVKQMTKIAEDCGLVFLRKLENNFSLNDTPDGHRAYIFHEVVILRHVEENTWRIRTGGYWTLTTKDRLNKALRDVGCPLRVWQERGKWYLSDFHNSYQKKDAVQLFDGIVIDLATLKVANPEEGEPAEFDRQHYEKLIKQYCKELKELEKLPAQDNGDCWYCHFMEEPDNTSHLIAHLEEGYIHGSLILNALCAAGYRNPYLIFEMDHRDSIVRSVHKYFRKALGLVR
jgi:hypothetical protein